MYTISILYRVHFVLSQIFDGFTEVFIIKSFAFCPGFQHFDSPVRLLQTQNTVHFETEPFHSNVFFFLFCVNNDDDDGKVFVTRLSRRTSF